VTVLDLIGIFGVTMLGGFLALQALKDKREMKDLEADWRRLEEKTIRLAEENRLLREREAARTGVYR
jgi:hypothetical protein